MFRAGHNTLFLNTADSLCSQGSTKIRVIRNALPITTAFGNPPDWTDDWTKCNVDAFGFELSAHM